MLPRARDEHRRLLSDVNLRSYIIAPLIAREQVLGAVAFVSSESGRHFGSHDMELAQELARRAACHPFLQRRRNVSVAIRRFLSRNCVQREKD